MRGSKHSLRKAAVLISSLETDIADTLLDQMGPEQAARVRNAILYLGDVPVDEQEQVLAEFFGNRVPVVDDEVEFALSAASQAAAERIRETQPLPVVMEVINRFAFLELAPGLELANYLRGEHPQVISVVVTQLSPEKAAELLRFFSADLQDEIIDRLGTGADADAEILTDIETQLRQRFADCVRVAESTPRRRDHLQAILRHLHDRPTDQAEVKIKPLAKPSSFSKHPELPASDVPPFPTASFDVQVSDEVDFEFEELLSLNTLDFFAVFEEADPRLVMLALAGAPRRMFDRFVAQYSAERAEEFERHLEQLRPLSLRDVETAQQELARIAACRLQAAKPAAENSRKFAVAA